MGGGGNGTAIATATAEVAITASTLARRLTLTGPATAAEGADATYTVALAGTDFANPAAITWTVTHGETSDADLSPTTGSIMFPTDTTFAIGIVDDDATAPDEGRESFTVTIAAPDTASEVSGSGVTTTIGQDDDPAARANRVKTPLAAFAKGITQLAAHAISQRLRFTGTSAFNLSPTPCARAAFPSPTAAAASTCGPAAAASTPAATTTASPTRATPPPCTSAPTQNGTTACSASPSPKAAATPTSPPTASTAR